MLKIILIALTLISCGSIPTGAKLPLPPEVVYPSIQASELQCLTDKTYEKLNARRALCEARIETLNGIIRSTH